jgi:subfamily B ATP-binding cassette protein MsbA
MANEKKSRPPQSLKQIWPDVRALLKPRRRMLAVGVVLIAINRAAGLVLPASTKYFIDDVISAERFDLIGPLVLAILAATGIQGITDFGLTHWLSKSAQRLIAELRRKVQQHVGRLPVTYYDSNKTGALVSRIMSDVEGVRNLVGTGLVQVIGGILSAVAALVVLLTISATLTGAALAVVLVFVVVLYYAFTTLRPIFRERGKIRADVTGRLSESLAGVRVIKGYHAEEREAGVFSKGVERLLDNVLKTLTGIALLSLSATMLLGMVGGVVMYLGTKQIAAGAMTVGDLLMFTAFIAFLVGPIFQMVNIGTQLTEALAGLERTRELLNERPEDEDPRRQASLGTIRGEILFENVNFAYEEGKAVLDDVSFDVQPGTVTALVGPSGSGKSTIIGLIAAFHSPGAGRVLVDGVDLSTVRLADYRTQLGVVLQESFLFDGSIEENVGFGHPGASKDEVVAACRIARVDEFAERFEEKYDTIVGERGVKLSGGQRQRVSIARAILADPRILILDEATSSLDSESEQLIQQGLAYLMQGRTTFVIAHRLSTIRKADQILVIEDGRVAERGTHETLYEAGGRYFDLYTKQHGLESNLFLAPGEGDSIPGEESGRQAHDDTIREAMRMLRG